MKKIDGRGKKTTFQEIAKKGKDSFKSSKYRLKSARENIIIIVSLEGRGRKGRGGGEGAR